MYQIHVILTEVNEKESLIIDEFGPQSEDYESLKTAMKDLEELRTICDKIREWKDNP